MNFNLLGFKLYAHNIRRDFRSLGQSKLFSKLSKPRNFLLFSGNFCIVGPTKWAS